MKPTTMSITEIKKQLAIRDILLVDIAQALSVTSSQMTLVAQGTVKSRRSAQAICNALDKPMHEVFGNTYDKVTKSGPKDRTARKAQIKEALLNNTTVPLPTAL